MERWERELQRLRGLTLSGRARARVDRGPEGDGMPPAPARGQRVLAGVVAFAVFGGAVALAAGAFGGDDAPPLGTDPEPAVLTLEADDAGPDIALTFGGDEAGQQCMSYGWETDGGGFIADCLVRDFSQADFLPIPQGRELTVVNPDRADPVHLWIVENSSWLGSTIELGDPVRPEGLSSIDPGRYVLTVEASWAQGVVTNYFAVAIVDDSRVPEGALVATLDAPEDGSMPDLVLSYGSVTEDFFAQGGEWPGVTGYDEPLLHFTPTLARGTVLQVDGDADDVQVWVEAVDEDDRLTGAKTPLDVSGGAAVVPSGVTRYQLEIWGSWSEGTAGYFVRIRIGEGVAPAPSPTPSAGPSPPPTEAPPSTSSTTPDPESIAGTSWELEEIDGEPIAVPLEGELGSVPTLILGEDRLGGSTGCNRYGADWSLEDGALRTGRVVMTLIGCGGSVGDVEQRFLAIIGGDPRVSIGDGVLVLTADGGVATLARIDVEHDDIVGSFLDCAPADHVTFTHGGMYAQPAPPAYFTANMTGLKDGDEFVRFAGSADFAEESRWLVVREGLVVAEVNYAALDGVACRYSGVQGA